MPAEPYHLDLFLRTREDLPPDRYVARWRDHQVAGRECEDVVHLDLFGQVALGYRRAAYSMHRHGARPTVAALAYGRRLLDRLTSGERLGPWWRETTMLRSNRPIRLELGLPGEVERLRETAFELLAEACPESGATSDLDAADRSHFLFRREGSALVRVRPGRTAQTHALRRGQRALLAWANTTVRGGRIEKGVFQQHEAAFQDGMRRLGLYAMPVLGHATIDSLRSCLERGGPVDFIVLIAHGAERGGGLVLHRALDGEPEPEGECLLARDLAEMLRAAGTKVALLWSCHGSVAHGAFGAVAEALLGQGDLAAVVAAHGSIGATSSVELARGFFDALHGAAGGDLERAVTAARRRIPENDLQWSIMEVHARPKGGRSVYRSVEPSPGALPPTWNIPEPPAGFVGREVELAILDRAGPGTVALTQAVTGLGGVGKSTLARRWAWSRASEVSLGWWLRAEAPAQLDDDLLDLGREIGMFPKDAVIEDRPAALRKVRAWLRSPTALSGVPEPSLPWVLILDNACDPVSVVVPVGRGVVLVTSRDRRWERQGQALKVEVLPKEPARTLLRAGLEGSGNSDAEAEALAGELGWLPLALAQAHAYCHENGVTLRRYRTQLGCSPTLFSYEAGTGEATVATTWALLVDGLVARSRAVLEVLAFFAPEDIPVEALFMNAEGVSPEISAVCTASEALDRALGDLHRMCLVQRNGDRVDVHRLVQRVTRDSLDEEARAGRLHEAQQLFAAAMPDPRDPAGWPLWRRLAPHAEALAHVASPPSDRILGQLAMWRWTQASYEEALTLDRRALAITERAVGSDHPDTGVRLNNIAMTLLAMGLPRDARPLQERALAIAERAFGPDHPTTANRLGNLASMLSLLGYHKDALALKERALAITVRALGADHPMTGTRLGNLAETLLDLGRHQDARSLQEQALEVTERALGPNHPDTAVRLGNLASTLWYLGFHKEAQPLVERAFAISETALGPDHPTTAIRLGNLAETLSSLGQHEEARPLKERALAITERALGGDHPATATRLNNLAWTLSALGLHLEARSLQLRAIDITERVLGSDHPTTGGGLGNLAVTEWTLGLHADAMARMNRALRIFDALGADHPTAVHYRQQLARMAEELSKLRRGD